MFKTMVTLFCESHGLRHNLDNCWTMIPQVYHN